LVDDIIPEKGGIALFMYKRAENPGKGFGKKSGIGDRHISV